MLLMIFASHHLSARHALSLRLQSWLQLIDLAFLLPPPSLPPVEQPDKEKQNVLATTGYLQKSSENQSWKGPSRRSQRTERKLRPSKCLCHAQSQATIWKQSSDWDSCCSVHPSPTLPLQEEDGVCGAGGYISDELCRFAWQWAVVGR